MAKKRLNFFLNGQLHRWLTVNRGKDLLYTWNYPEHRRMTYTYTDALRRMEPAFSSRQVAMMLNRDKTIVERAVWQGLVPQPQYTYGLETGRMYQYMWSEKEIFGLHEYLSGIHYGRPRKDGIIVPYPLPTPRELRAMCRDEAVLTDDNYVPTWKAKEIKGE